MIKFFKITISVLTLTLSLAAQTAQQIAQTAFASTVLLVMEDDNGQPLSFGSGFFISDGLIASNYHVVEGASRGYAKLIGEKTKYDIEGYVAVDTVRDLVILKISSPGNPTLKVNDSDHCQVGEKVFAVGNPQGLEGTFSQGIISSIRDAGSDKLLQITAPISPGSSGGPVLNEQGKVIGVSVATYRGGQNLNFAIPVNYLINLAKNIGPVKRLSGSKSKSSKSILSDLGGRSIEGVVGGQFLFQYSTGGSFSFSLRNKLRDSVKSTSGLIVFYDNQGYPLDTFEFYNHYTIRGGLAKRLTGLVDSSVRDMVTTGFYKKPFTKVEIRVLNFEVVD